MERAPELRGRPQRFHAKAGEEGTGKHRVQFDVPKGLVESVADKTGTTKAGAIRNAIKFLARLDSTLPDGSTMKVLGEDGEVQSVIQSSVIFPRRNNNG